MSDIPDDIWEVAHQIGEQAWPFAEYPMRNKDVEFIARAILSERTKAAEIAEKARMPSEYSNSWHLGYRAAREDISQAIRKGGKE